MDEEKREKTALGATEEGVDAAALVSSSEAIGHFHAKADLRIRGDYAGANRKLYWASLRANAAKGAKTEWEELTSMKNRLSTGTKLTRGAHAANAEIELGKKVALKTVQKAGGEFYKGASLTIRIAAPALIIKSCMQAADVIMGKKDADDAAKDMAKTVGTITAAGGAYQAALTMTRGTTSHLVNTLLRSNVGVLVLQAGIELSQPLKQYVNGEITGQKFAQDAGYRGTSLAASREGSECGAAAGAILGPLGMTGGALLGGMIASIAMGLTGNQLLAGEESIEVYNEKSETINEIYKKVEEIIRKRQDEYQKMTEEELAHFDSVMGDGLHEIFTGALSSDTDYDTVTKGIDKVLAYWGRLSFSIPRMNTRRSGISH